MSRMLVKTIPLKTTCRCKLRVEQVNDERTGQFNVMIVGVPCDGEDCHGRQLAQRVKEWLVRRPGVISVDGQTMH